MAKEVAAGSDDAAPVAASCLRIFRPLNFCEWHADSRYGGEWGDPGHCHGAVSPGQLLQADRAG